jgi:hypothetical protein
MKIYEDTVSLAAFKNPNFSVPETIPPQTKSKKNWGKYVQCM